MSSILNNVESLLRSVGRIKNLIPVRSNNSGDERPSYKDDLGLPSTSTSGVMTKKKFVYSADHLSKDPLTFSGKFEYVECMGDKEDFNFRFDQPQKITYDRHNNLVFVAENRHTLRVAVFNATTLSFLYNFEMKEFLSFIDAMEADPKGDGIIILQKAKICKVSIDGKQRKWTTTLDSEMKDCTISDDGKIYCARNTYYREIEQPSVCIVDSSNGKVIGNVGQDMNGMCIAQKVSCICFNKDGNLCIANSYTSELTIITTKGKVVGIQQLPNVGKIESMKFDKYSNCIYAAYRNPSGTNAVVIAHPDGNETTYTGETIPNVGSGKTQHKFSASEMDLTINSTTGQLLLTNRIPDIQYECVIVFK